MGTCIVSMGLVGRPHHAYATFLVSNWVLHLLQKVYDNWRTSVTTYESTLFDWLNVVHIVHHHPSIYDLIINGWQPKKVKWDA